VSPKPKSPGSLEAAAKSPGSNASSAVSHNEGVVVNKTALNRRRMLFIAAFLVVAILAVVLPLTLRNSGNTTNGTTDNNADHVTSPSVAPTPAPTSAIKCDSVNGCEQAPTSAPTAAPTSAPTPAPTSASNGPASGPSNGPSNGRGVSCESDGDGWIITGLSSSQGVNTGGESSCLTSDKRGRVNISGEAPVIGALDGFDVLVWNSRTCNGQVPAQFVFCPPLDNDVDYEGNYQGDTPATQPPIIPRDKGNAASYNGVNAVVIIMAMIILMLVNVLN